MAVATAADSGLDALISTPVEAGSDVLQARAHRDRNGVFEANSSFAG